MNVICILLDSLNRHFLPVYGNHWVRTPNIDALAARSLIFEQNYIGSAPCMPARRDLWTGTWEFLWRPWGSLEPWDQPLPRLLRQAGVLTHLITDHYHLFERGGENYHIDFEGWEFIRGHENDPWVTDPAPEKPPFYGVLTDRYWRNMTRMRREADFLAPRTLQAAADWLERNHQRDNFFLMIDEFDPHEPFHVPPPYDTMYDPDWDGPLYFWDRYGRTDEEPETHMRHIRAQYAGKVTMTDRWLGRVLERIDDFGLWDNTAIILMTDHGHFLGEHGWMGKPTCPAYQTIAHTPLLIHLPGSQRAGERIDALTTTVDLYPTILEWFGVEPPPHIHGRSLVPLLEGKVDRVRDYVLYGWWGQSVNYADGTYTYLRHPQSPDNTPLEAYSLRWSTAPWWEYPDLTGRVDYGRFMPQTEMLVGRMAFQPEDMARLSADPARVVRPSMLFNIREDEAQEHDLAGTPLEEDYAERLRRALYDVQAPESQFRRLGL
ncbi:MAG: sulfatase-like hydrolase/transferase [Anaerolineae bacterium]